MRPAKSREGKDGRTTSRLCEGCSLRVLLWRGFYSRCPFSPSPLVLPHHFVYIRRWTYLDRSTLQLHSWRLGNELNCVIQLSRFQHLNSTQLLLRFRVRTVCHCNLSVLPTHGHRRVGGLKRF